MIGRTGADGAILTGAGVFRPDGMDASAGTILKSHAEFAQYVQADLRERVATARSMGLSWAQIGDALGVTRQAAQQTYGTPR